MRHGMCNRYYRTHFRAPLFKGGSMKKLIIILAVLACVSTFGIAKAEASGSSFYADGTVTPLVLPLSGQPGKFRVTFFGVLTTSYFDGYQFPLPSGTDPIDCNGCTFEIIAETDDGPLTAGSTTSFEVSVGGFFGGRWEPLSQNDATPDLTFKVRYTGPFGLYGPFEFDSEEFAICDIAGATSHIDICKPVVEDPNSVCGDGILDTTEECDDGNMVSGDGCSAICETEGIACDDDDQDGICNLDDPDNDNDGWTDVEEDDCITDPLDANDQPLDDDGDGICNLLDDDPSSSTSADDDDTLVDTDGNAAEFGGGNCSLNPNATADFGTLFFLTLLCLTTPIAVMLHIRRKR